MKKNVLAIDLGASSGRAVLGIYSDGKMILKEIHRFANNPVKKQGHLYWDITSLFNEIIKAISNATDICKIDSLAFNTWGVDYGIIDKNGNLIEDPVHYRDIRTKNSIQEVSKIIPLEDLYKETGIQIMPMNTIFQLFAQKQVDKKLENGETLLLMPDLFNYLLTGKICTELSIASTTQLIDPRKKQWNEKLITSLGFPIHLFNELVTEANLVGNLLPDYGLPPIPVINVCAHDTASAIVSIPSKEEFLFISCGTWSLIGTERTQPLISDEIKDGEFTNELGADQRITFLKNITGLWILQELKKEIEEQGKEYSYDELVQLANESQPFSCIIDIEDSSFVAPKSMMEAIKKYAEKTGQNPPVSIGSYVRCIYESMALKYQDVINDIERLTKHKYETVYIIGGGSRARLLCQMVADASQRKVIAGPVEATVFGNILMQLKYWGVFNSLKDIREWVMNNISVNIYNPNPNNKWKNKINEYKKIIKKTKHWR